MKYNRKIKTNLEATNKNYEILDSILGQMSDGIWAHRFQLNLSCFTD